MSLMPNVHFNKGEVIFEEGYPADSVYLVCDGKVEIFKKRENEHISLAILGENSIFGEMAFISEKPRSATVMAIEDTWCYSLSKDSFLQKLKNSDQSIVNVFEDLAETIREKSKAAIIIDHGKIEPLDELQMMELINPLNQPSSQYSYEYLTKSPELVAKVEKMDLFMRTLFMNMVKIAFN